MSDTPRTDELSARVFGGKFNMLEVVNAFEEQCAHFERELTTANAALAAKDKEIERLTTNGVHTCHAECERPLCVADRQLRAKERQVRELVDFVGRIARQRRSRPDYWNPCGQCDSNIEDAKDFLAQHPAPPSPGGDTREEVK